jgi:hypothetical protein
MAGLSRGFAVDLDRASRRAKCWGQSGAKLKSASAARGVELLDFTTRESSVVNADVVH